MVKDVYGRSMNKTTITILVLAVLLVAAVVYISIGKYNQIKQTEQLNTFQQGAQYGYQQAVLQLAQQAATCQQVPVQVGNQSISLVAVECLQAAANK